MCVYTRICTCIHTLEHDYACKYARIHIYTSLYTHTHTHTHTHTAAQDMAASVFLAYASRNFEHVVPFGGAWFLGGGHSPFKDHQAQALHRLSLSMGSAALALAVLVCMGLVAYRMVFGDDHGHVRIDKRSLQLLTSKQRRQAVFQSVVGRPLGSLGVRNGAASGVDKA